MIASNKGKLQLLYLLIFIFSNASASYHYTHSNTKVEIYKKQCKGDTHIFDITEAFVECKYGKCKWGSHGTLITTYQFGDLFPTASPTLHPTRYPSPEPSKRKLNCSMNEKAFLYYIHVMEVDMSCINFCSFIVS